MFPLGTVLLPGAGLPLHVFEPRYRQMVKDVLAADGPAEFGVVLIVRGTEVGGGDERADVATVARIIDARVTGDGRYALMAGGHRRIRVIEWLADDPYPQAMVQDWPDAAADDPSAVVAETRRLRDDVATLRARVGLDAVTPPALADDSIRDAGPVVGSYRLAAWTPAGPADAHRALCASGPVERLAVLAAVVDDLTAVADFRDATGGGDPR